MEDQRTDRRECPTSPTGHHQIDELTFRRVRDPAAVTHPGLPYAVRCAHCRAAGRAYLPPDQVFWYLAPGVRP